MTSLTTAGSFFLSCHINEALNSVSVIFLLWYSQSSLLLFGQLCITSCLQVLDATS